MVCYTVFIIIIIIIITVIEVARRDDPSKIAVTVVL
jgi:hypothetical protein